MTIATDDLIRKLKQELEYHEPEQHYSQWIMGVSINNVRQGETKDSQTVIARTVVKTNQSPYVDGMDIDFAVKDGQLTMNKTYFENSPEYMGGTIKDSLAWMQVHGDLVYQQMDDPYDENETSNEKGR